MDGLVWSTVENSQKKNDFIEFFSQNGIQSEVIRTVNNRAAEDENKDKVRRMRRKVPFTRTFIPSEKYPDFDQRLRVSVSRGNRYIKATGEMRAGEKIAEAKPFACVADKSTHPYCITCKAEESVSRPCPHCHQVLFCYSDECLQNQTHQYECNTNFHCVEFGEDLDVKLAIQMVFECLAIYGSVPSLMKLKFPNRNNNYPTHIRTPIERFQCIMKLHNYPPENYETKVFAALKMISDFDQIKRLFRTSIQKRFLEHLLAHFLRVIAANSFELQQPHIRLCAIYDSISFFNHSCSPNASTFISESKMIVISSRQIQPRDQVYICYKSEFYSAEYETQERREMLNSLWKFHCECERCENGAEINQRDIVRVNKTLLRGLRSNTGRLEALELALNPQNNQENNRVWSPYVGALCIQYFKTCEDQIK